VEQAGVRLSILASLDILARSRILGLDHLPEMACIEHDEMIEAVAADADGYLIYRIETR
jgi:hypothetical protein